jgi:hypothetical protein
MYFLRLHIRRLLHLAETALLRYGTQPQTMFFLAALSVLDGFVPMLPTEAFVVVFGILQPQRGKVIVLLFALASGLSALILALLLGTLNSSAEWLGLQLLGAQWDQASSTVRTWGPASMVFLSVFPDTPRTSIAALALSGVAPEVIGLMVFIPRTRVLAACLSVLITLISMITNYVVDGYDFFLQALVFNLVLIGVSLHVYFHYRRVSVLSR